MQKIELYKAIEALRSGKIVIYPTDTLYALGVDVYNENSVRKIFEVKNRPPNNPLPVAVSDIVNIEKIAFVNGTARKLAEYFLPGPLTMILNKKSIIPDVVTGGLDNIAVRIPNNDLALKLLSQYCPLTVTSANIHGKEVPDIVRDIMIQFNSNDVDVYLDNGKLNGMPSTIVDVTTSKPRIVREGIITKKEILDVF